MSQQADPEFVPVLEPVRCAHLDESGELVWTTGQLVVHESVLAGFVGHMRSLYPDVGMVAPDDGEPYETPDGP